MDSLAKLSLERLTVKQIWEGNLLNKLLLDDYPTSIIGYS